MQSKRILNFIALSSLVACMTPMAWADVYQCSTDDGSITLSNVEKGKNCKKMVLPPPSSKKLPAAKADKEKPVAAESKPPEKPKNSYESAAADRKRIIQEEIDLEKNRLGTVQTRIKDLAALPTKSPDQVKEMVALQQKENLHMSNLKILQKELNK